MLGEIVEGARALTGAQLGIASTVDRAGTPAHYAFSGFSGAAQREVLEWPEGLCFVEHLHEAPGPLRVETGGEKKKPWRYRWPDEVHDEVLARLLALNAEPAAEERMAGKAQ